LVADVVGYRQLAAAEEDRMQTQLREWRNDLIDRPTDRAPWPAQAGLMFDPATLSLPSPRLMATLVSDDVTFLAKQEPALEGLRPAGVPE
jgi:hypothetical protein